MSVFAINLITGAGLGLAIDYSLFVVSRFREELATGAGRGDALRATMRTAGRTVLFSAVTVAAAMAALIVFHLRFLYSMGVGGVLVALTAALVSLTVLPALLAALGPRVNALSLKRWQVAIHRDAAHVRAGPWYRFSQFVMRRPGPIAAGTAVLLIVLGLPFLRIDFTGVDASVLPSDRSARVVAGRARHRVPARAHVADLRRRAGPATPAAVRAYARRLGAAARRRRRCTRPSRPTASGGSTSSPARPRCPTPAKQLVRDVRAAGAPFPVQVGGGTARVHGPAGVAAASSLPLALALLCTTTLVILFVMTGSVVLPVKALLMNLLTLSAAFGLLVLIFQDGRLEGLLDFEAQGALESTQPILLFASRSGSRPTTACSC